MSAEEGNAPSSQASQAPQSSPEEYVSILEVHVKSKRIKVARDLAAEAAQVYPEDPLIASYHGLLSVLSGVDKKTGLKTCMSKVEESKKSDLEKPVRANLHLNLGRAYLGMRMKKEAVETFRDGLRLNRKNKTLYWELRKLGVRRKPVISFLKRSNIINRCLGILLYRYVGLKGISEEAPKEAPD